MRVQHIRCIAAQLGEGDVKDELPADDLLRQKEPECGPWPSTVGDGPVDRQLPELARELPSFFRLALSQTVSESRLQRGTSSADSRDWTRRHHNGL